MATTTATLDKATYNKGDKVTLTVVDTTRANTATGSVASMAGPMPFTITIQSPAGAVTCTGYVFTLVSDTVATSTTVWTTSA